VTAFRHVWRLAAAFLLLAVVAAALFSIVPTRSDMTILLPERGDGDLALLFRSLRQGPANRAFLIGLAPEAAAAGDPRALSRAFKDGLEKTGRFEWVANGEFPQDRAAIEPFFAHRYRLNPPLDPAEFSAVGLRSALERLLDLLQGVAAPVVSEIMTDDPTLRTLSVAALWTPPTAPARQGVWTDGTGRQVLLLARTSAAGFDLAAQESAMAAVRAVADGLEPKFGRLDLALSGPSVIAVESKTVAEAESRRLILISVPLVAGLVLLFLRRIAVLPVLFLPLGCGFLAATAVVGAVFGYVHVTTLGFGVTLLGVAVDYPLHLLARARGAGGVAAAARKIWPGLLIAVSTTCLAFLPLVVSSFPGLAQLGLFSVTGLAVAVVVTRWILPRLVADGDRTAGLAPMPAPRAMRLLRLPALLAGGVALAALGLRAEPLWQQDLAVLSPIPEDVRARDQALRGNLQVPDPRYVLTVSATDVETAVQRSERLLPSLAALRDSKVLDGFEMAALYVPSHAAQAARLAALPPDATMRTNLERAQQGLPFKPAAFEPFLQALAAARAGPPLSPADLPEATLRARLEPLLIQAEDGIKALILLRGVRNPAELQRAVDETGTTGVRYLDIKQSAQDLMDGYRAETLRWVSVGGVLALALLIATLRAARAVAMVAAPVVLSVLVTTAVMAQVAGGLSIFHLLGLLMVAGLGIDYAVFLQEKEGEGVRAVALCAATSIAVFALLATASVPILSQIGWTVAVGSLLSFALGLVFAAPTAERAP
jgi:predicted exporter